VRTLRIYETQGTGQTRHVHHIKTVYKKAFKLDKCLQIHVSKNYILKTSEIHMGKIHNIHLKAISKNNKKIKVHILYRMSIIRMLKLFMITGQGICK